MESGAVRGEQNVVLCGRCESKGDVGVYFNRAQGLFQGSLFSYFHWVELGGLPIYYTLPCIRGPQIQEGRLRASADRKAPAPLVV